jgi:hypothetical protein
MAAGGLLIKGLGELFKFRSDQEEAEANFRDQLAKQVEATVVRVAKLESDIDIWKAKYYELFAQHAVLKLEHNNLQTAFTRLETKVQNGSAAP